MYLERLKEMQAILEKKSTREHNVDMLAVTKYQSVSAIQELYSLAVRSFAENKVQSAIEKFGSPPLNKIRSCIALHLIGRLQKNKVKKALETFDCIQSVANLDLAKVIMKKTTSCVLYKDPFPLYLQVNPLHEEQKQGFESLVALREAYALLQGCVSINIVGLMVMAPYTDDTSKIRDCFKITRVWRDSIDTSLGLSMGMSNDYRIALEEGSTLLRIGSYLFN